MRIVVYTRQSFDRAGEGLAVARQLEDARDLASRRGWTIVAEHSDNDVSAAGTKRRPGFEAALSDVREGRADGIVSWALDRLTRNRRDTVRLIETCQAANALVALVRGSDIDMTTPAGRLVADILASVARAEIETKSDRQRRANEQRAREGKPMPGVRAYGYQRGNAELEPVEAANVRRGYDQLLAGGSLRSIARAWNDAGSLTPRGNPWNGSTVRRTLLKPRYAGLRQYQGEVIGKGSWEPIIGEDTFRAAMHVLGSPDRSTVADRSIKFLLTSIAECGRCDDGSKMTTARTSKGVRTYKCSERSDVARKADAIDEFVTLVVLERLGAPDAHDLLAVDTGPHVEALRTEAAALRVQLDEAADLFTQRAIRATQLAKITAGVEERLAEVEGELTAVARGDALAAIIGTGDIHGAWDNADILTKRAIVKLLFARVVIEPVPRGSRTFDPTSVRIEWRAA